MSTAWPTDIIADEVNFRLVKNVTAFPSPLVNTVQILDRPGRFWRCDFSIVVPGLNNIDRMDALLDSDVTFLMWDQKRSAPRNGVAAGIQLVGAHLRGNTLITVDGLPISQTHLVAGDYIGIGGKLYRLIADVASDTGGEGTLTLNRGLVADAADNAAVNTDRPTCEMMLVDNEQTGRNVDANWAPTYNLGFREVI
jgi:hypothetical protein